MFARVVVIPHEVPDALQHVAAGRQGHLRLANFTFEDPRALA